MHTRAPCGKLAFAFVDYLQWPHDSNLTATLLIKALVKFMEDRSLPDTLYIQMDNTSRENKNKYVLGFCAALVQLQIFKKVCHYKRYILYTHSNDIVYCDRCCYLGIRYFCSVCTGADQLPTCRPHPRRCGSVVFKNCWRNQTNRK